MKREREKKENSTELQKPNVEAEVYNKENHDWIGCGEREAMMMALPLTCDSVLPCFHGCLAFLHRHFPPRSPPSHPLSPSVHSQQQPLP